MTPLPGPSNNRCPSHPEEPITGLCGCGSFFCRRCSSSPVLCGSCLAERERGATLAGAAVIERHGLAATPRSQPHHRPLSQRVLIEALLMTILLVGAFYALFFMYDKSPAFSEDDSFVTFGIDSTRDPIQKEADRFRFTLYTADGAEVTLTSQTAYSISAKVQNVASYDDAMGDAVPYDLLLAWGQMAEEDVDSRLTWEQADRRGTVTGSLGGSSGPAIDADYVVTHVSNNHVIPANENIAAALDMIEAGDIVRIDGRLVDMRMVKGDELYTVNTSKSRTDQGDGACEIIFVERIRINGETYS